MCRRVWSPQLLRESKHGVAPSRAGLEHITGRHLHYESLGPRDITQAFYADDVSMFSHPDM